MDAKLSSNCLVSTLPHVHDSNSKPLDNLITVKNNLHKIYKQKLCLDYLFRITCFKKNGENLRNAFSKNGPKNKLRYRVH